MTAEDVIRLLGLLPHPEGGHYRETFRDWRRDASGRSASTAIYYLLKQGEQSAWHRVDAVEIWHWHAGAALQLEVCEIVDMQPRSAILGSALASGARPQLIVPAQHWQRARPLGDWCLVGCTVAPGFEFSGFEMARADLLPTDWT